MGRWSDEDEREWYRWMDGQLVTPGPPASLAWRCASWLCAVGALVAVSIWLYL